MKGKRISIEKIKQLIESKDGELLGEKTIKRVRYITIKCNKDGNIWTPRLSNITNKGNWCRECYKRNKVLHIKKEKVLSLLSDMNLRLLTEDEITFWSKIKVRCNKHNHEWITSYGTLERGDSNCTFCGHGAVDFKTLNKVIIDNNAMFIKRIKTKCTVRNILLRCMVHDHEWTTNSTDIMKVDRWCKYCTREARKTPYEKIKAKVEEKNGKLLTKNCKGSLTKIRIQCSNNHEWDTYYDNINQGRWCPVCVHSHQGDLYSILKELYSNYNIEYNYRQFEWLKMNKTKKHKMEIDIWVPEMKLAIEYDGVQHFQPTKFYTMSDEKAKKIFHKVKRHDRKKNKLIAAHPNDVNYFIRFNYKDKINKEAVIKKLKENNIPIPNEESNEVESKA